MANTPTHAGGIVFRCKGHIVEYLLVRPSDNADEWVLPKGHINQGEDPAEAALREVCEETGVVARLVGLVADNVRFFAKGEDVTVWFYLMEFLSEMPPAENREKQWVSLEEAMKRIKFEETRKAIKSAESMRSARLEG
jgi:ADP-ribose pyrophosphatase YjhB (NUDIX family)